MSNAAGPPQRKALRHNGLWLSPLSRHEYPPMLNGAVYGGIVIWNHLFLPPKGGYFLSASQNSGVLFGKSSLSLVASGLANLENHRILTPIVAGVNPLLCLNGIISQRGPIELQHLFAANRTTIRGSFVARNSDSKKAHTSLTLSLFDDGKLHFFFSLGDDARIIQETFCRVNPHS